MGFAGMVWRLLVGIKDALALLFLLLFFTALYMLLSARANPGEVREGALLLELDGYVVEEASRVDPIQALLAMRAPIAEYQTRDLVHALDAAAKDDRIKVVVLDLNRFLGGGQVHLQDVGAALDRVRQADKPVLAHSMFYGDDGMLLAAHASEVWLEPMGGAFIAGPGGTRLYYRDLFDRYGVKAHVYRTGSFKSAVEPYLRSDMSPEARESSRGLYGALWEEWQANVKKARPSADIRRVTGKPDEWVAEQGGDLAKAALAAGLVDKLGGRVEFGERVAEIAGEDRWNDLPGSYAYTDLEAWEADLPEKEKGEAIGVITIAGDIIDGGAGPGTAGGTRIAEILDEALADGELKGLVVRIDSPGGTVTASEEIRRAILRHKAKGIPVAVSMANIAASGGYWVATPGDRIFAEPETITGSIGIYAMLPTFEDALPEFGINPDGVRTSPLSGQPDMLGGFTPEMDSILQSSLEGQYARFIDIVAKSRKMTPEAVDRVAQGHVWDGGTARQIGLVDQYGGLDDALAWVVGEAKLGAKKWHPEFLGDDADTGGSPFLSLLFGSDARENAHPGDVFAVLARQRMALGDRMLLDLQRFAQVSGAQAHCLECPALPRGGIRQQLSASSQHGNLLALLRLFARN